ncbi:MAG TPA: tetratricopeptide repeat protein [Verrucomicrobiae bacterium]|jgi:tetratricopeptide (TPR) repeat protein|nr:tetratricopeptide repeat protein [Verrucomicrobiae bacterium]
MARPRTICLLLALVTVLVYSPVRHAAFVVFDDPDYVGDNHVQAGLTWAGVKWAFTTWHASNWHPLTWLSHMVDASLFGPNSGAQHLVNVLFHAANALLLFLLLFRATSKLWPAAMVAALFAWHPLHVESVAWVSERKDVLSTFFGLLAVMAYARFSRRDRQGPSSKSWYVGAVVLFALSLMAKPMLVTLPFVLLLLDIWPLERWRSFETRNVPRLLLEKAPFLLLTLASCVVTFLAQRSVAVMSLEQRPLGLRLANALVSYVEYLGKMIWPARLAVIYPLPDEIPMWQIVGGAVILAAISWMAWAARKTRPYLLVGWLLYLGTLVPVIGLVQVGGQAFADRYTYVPSIGIFIALAYGAADLAVRFRIPRIATAAIATLVLAANLFGTERQLAFWQSSETLFTHAIELTKKNAVAHLNLGVALEQDNRQPEALKEYRAAVQIDPHRFQSHNNLANLLATMGSRDEALKEYLEALRLNPNAALAHVNLGTLYVDMGRFDDAMREYSEAARLAPEDPRPHYLIGKVSLRRRQSGEAVKYFREALLLGPNDFQTLTWLARVLAADENSGVRNGAEAVSLAQQANDLTDGEQPFVLDTLAMAYAEAGRFKEAKDTVQKAIELATAAGAQKNVPEMQQRLQLYQAGQPFREDFAKAAE